MSHETIRKISKWVLCAILIGFSLVCFWMGFKKESMIMWSAAAAGQSHADQKSRRAMMDAENSGTILETSDNALHDPTPRFETVISDITAHFGEQIEDPQIQIALIEELQGYLQSRYPESWRSFFKEILMLAFPRHVRQILQLSEKLEHFKTWQLRNRYALEVMDAEERRSLLLRKRQEIFGETARTIWIEEEQSFRIQSYLRDLEQDARIDLEKSIADYRQAIEETYAEDARVFVAQRRQELTDAFLAAPAVQKELEHMTPEERSTSLNNLRKTMGYDEAAVRRLSDLDNLRNHRWEAGQAYMAETETARIAHAGEDLENELDRLRAKYFQSQAQIIEQEENSGFFRFRRDRVYGKN